MGCLFDNPLAGLPLLPAEVNNDYYARLYREATTLASLAWNPNYDPKLERRLARITAPTLVVWGEHDRYRYVNIWPRPIQQPPPFGCPAPPARRLSILPPSTAIPI